LATEIGPDSTVVVPTLTFLATANAVRHVGAEVVFADVDPDSGLMRAEDVSAALAQSAVQGVHAVMPVHLNGQTADTEAIRAVTDLHDAVVIEDACHAIGGRHLAANDPVGACRHSAAAAFSFHPAKTIAMGEGGAVTTNDETLAARMRQMRNHGMSRNADDFTSTGLAIADDGTANPWYYEMEEPGFNYRASDLHCALGLSQLSKLDARVAYRAALVERYDAAISNRLAGVRPLTRVTNCDPAWHLYVVHIDFAELTIDRASLMNRLAARGIGTQVHYLPVHMQPYYRNRYGDLDLPGARRYYERCLSLPLSVSMTEDDVDRVVAELETVLADV
jgi:dTDP-4-amino-4,6-dideoxygalactose transaminase